jgi:hypothetical protein
VADPEHDDDPEHDPTVETFDRVFSPDRLRLAVWRIARASDLDEERCLYDVTVEDTATREQIAHLTRWWTRDRHTRVETGARLSSVSFGSSGALLILKFDDGSREGVPLRPARMAGATPADELLDPSQATIFVDQEPCSICGVAAWSKAVCDSCATYCEQLLASGGVGPRKRSTPPCGFCGRHGPLAVSNPLGSACADCLAKLRSL